MSSILVKDNLLLFATSNVELIAGCASFNGWKAIAAGISFNAVKVTSTYYETMVAYPRLLASPPSSGFGFGFSAFAPKCKVIRERDTKSHARHTPFSVTTHTERLTEASHNTGNFMPCSFRIVCGFFNVPQ